MSSAYVNFLRQEQATASDSSTASHFSLQERFVIWHASLPEVVRYRDFSMTEFETALSTQGKYLGPVLLRLGWSRHRRWAATGEYNRYWKPPYGH